MIFPFFSSITVQPWLLALRPVAGIWARGPLWVPLERRGRRRAGAARWHSC